MSKIKDLYKFMDFGNRHIDNREEIKEANFANNKNEELPKILIANDYFSDWDSIALKQSTDPRINKAVNQDIYYNFSEPDQVSEKLFADWDALKDIEFTDEQRNILESEEISQNPPLKIALFKWFMYIWRKVRKLIEVKRIQDRKEQKKGDTKYLERRKLLESKLQNRPQNYKILAPQAKMKNWSTTNRNRVRGTCKKLRSVYSMSLSRITIFSLIYKHNI